VPRSRKLEDALDALAELRREPYSAETATRLRAALAARQAPLVARAARIAGDEEDQALVPELRSAFHRLLLNPVKSDPGCAAKSEIATALYKIGAYEDALFLIGARHVQLEPVWGGTQDTACDLRAACVLGLVRLNHPEAHDEIAELLADREPAARIGAARAIAYSEDARFSPLLRFKILAGDEEPLVIAECLGALLRVAGAGAFPFCERLLDDADAHRREAVALALGESRLAAALPLLRAWWQRTSTLDLRRTALLAIAMLRSEHGEAFLLSVIREAPGHDARDAIAALGIFRDDAALRQRVVEVATARDDVDLRAAITALGGGRRG
jgi:hypothetical protein